MTIVVDAVDGEDGMFLDGRVSFGRDGGRRRILHLDVVLRGFAICAFVSMEERGHIVGRL
jgi:hypothetical protein